MRTARPDPVRRGPARRRTGTALFGLILILAGCQQMASPGANASIEGLTVHQGFDLRVFAIVPGADALALAPDGAVLVGTDAGEVIELRDHDGDGVADSARHLVVDLQPPLSLAVGTDGKTIIATRDRVLALQPSGRLGPVLPPRLLPERDPDKALRLAPGPEGRLYLAIPAACRSCRSNGFAASIVGMRPDGHDLTIFARGVPWPGGMTWHPASGNLLVSDSSTTGRSPDTLKVVQQAGAEPLFQASILTPTPAGAGTRTSVALSFPTGSTPTGVSVIEGRPFGGPAALVALAGSGPPRYGVAPELVAVPLDERGRPGRAEVVVGGFGMPGRAPRRRPVGLLALGDGSVLISDDLAGVIYRLGVK